MQSEPSTGTAFKIFMLVLALAVIAALSLGSLPTTIVVEDGEYPPIGAGSCTGALYDSNGRRYNILGSLRVDYQGPAPLFEVPPIGETTGESPETSEQPPCPIYPDTVSPSVAVQGKRHYPLSIEPIVGQQASIAPGGSTTLVAKASFENQYVGLDEYFTIPLPTTGQITTLLSLETTAFDFEPKEDQSKPVSLTKDAEFTWTLSPKENMMGEQTLGIGINVQLEEDELSLQTITIPIEIWSPLGINPQMVNSVKILGGFLLGLLAMVKLALEVLAMLRSSQTKKRQAQTPKRQKKR